MNLAEFRAQLEEDDAWRRAEILFFQNQAAYLPTKQEQNKYRRAIILLLYSHFEGFFKFALQVYVDAINGCGILCGEANHAIAAASLSEAFKALRDPSSKSDLFRNELPDDSKLHRLTRDREFVERTHEFWNRPVCIPDDAIDVESNLKPAVLRKNIYLLGLPTERFAGVERDINNLLRIRNQIAHGASKEGIQEQAYERFRKITFGLMDILKRELTKALQEQSYRKSPSPPAAPPPPGPLP
jgi:hypothetical protein